MALETKLYQKLSQQLVMTPQLQQAIKMLQLSKLELIDTIQQELEENPVLEEIEIKKEESIEEVESKDQIAEDDWDTYLSGSDFDKTSTRLRDKWEITPFENYTPQKTTLTDHLLWQLRMSNMDDESMVIGELLIGNINEDGYLDIGLEEVSASANTPIEKVCDVLRIIQEFDPPGVGARDLKECLLLQIRMMGLSDGFMEKIISDQLPLLEKKDYKTIAREMSVPVEEVVAAVKAISCLEPKPGRPFMHEQTNYIIPDVFVFKVGTEYRIMANDEGMPKLRLSNHYQKMLEGLEKDAPSREYLQEKVRAGSWLIKSLEQRDRTICKVMESIVRFQREFFEKGIRYMRPLILRDVAEDIKMHESTVSRVTSNKYAHTPQGIYELKYFFSSGITSTSGESASAESVKDMIKNIVAGEDPKKPYSDETLVELLKKSGIEIARRTVTKYREALRIPSSTKRVQKY